MMGIYWYAYGRAQALDVISLPKIFTPDLSLHGAFSYDVSGEMFFTGGVSGGYGLLPKSEVKPELLLGLLNSKVVNFYHHKIASQMRGGWFSYEARFIRSLPIADTTELQENIIVSIVKILLWLNGNDYDDINRASTRGEGHLNYWRQLLEGAVYELYFHKDLHAAQITLFAEAEKAKTARLAEFTGSGLTREAEKIAAVIFKNDHPIYRMLFDLQALPVVRIIEGKE